MGVVHEKSTIKIILNQSVIAYLYRENVFKEKNNDLKQNKTWLIAMFNLSWVMWSLLKQGYDQSNQILNHVPQHSLFEY